jgi:tetratricopeptide (TPR) repeat protein
MLQAFFCFMIVKDRQSTERSAKLNQQLITLLEKGFACQQQGELEAAERCYLEVLEKDARNEFALNLMGVVCIRAGRHAEAVKYLKAALSINDQDPETHNNLGLALVELKRFEDAQGAFGQSIKLNANQPVTLNNLGNAYAAVDAHASAIPKFEAALRLDNQYVDCLNNLCVSLREVGRLDHALQVTEHAIAIDSTNSRAFNNRGEVLLDCSQYEQAEEAFLAAIKVDNNIVARTNLSTALKQLGREQEALEVLYSVLKDEENNSEAHNHLGVLLEQLGDQESAARHFRAAISYTPNHASSWYQLAKLKEQRLQESELAEIHRQLSDPSTPDIFKTSLHFALAAEADKSGDYDLSMRHLLQAQAIKAARNPYDERAPIEHLEVSRKTFPLEGISPEPSASKKPTPIFIVGMPRSGTTLTEQILSAHSAITGAGELGLINDLVKRAAAMTNRHYPLCIELLSDAQAHELREFYFSSVTARFGFNQFVVDKNPLNYNFLGVIGSLFPEAKIVYCSREPMDNCVSIFRLPFDDNQSYAHDLAALGHYYRQHQRLMEFWRSCYPKQVIEVRYEDTVDDVDKQARRMLEFIGVDFQPEVLNFHASKRIVMTPSASQVRQPIYSDSIAAWKRYERYLGPLLKSLNS